MWGKLILDPNAREVGVSLTESMHRLFLLRVVHNPLMRGDPTHVESR